MNAGAERADAQRETSNALRVRASRRTCRHPTVQVAFFVPTRVPLNSHAVCGRARGEPLEQRRPGPLLLARAGHGVVMVGRSQLRSVWWSAQGPGSRKKNNSHDRQRSPPSSVASF